MLTQIKLELIKLSVLSLWYSYFKIEVKSWHKNYIYITIVTYKI